LTHGHRRKLKRMRSFLGTLGAYAVGVWLAFALSATASSQEFVAPRQLDDEIVPSGRIKPITEITFDRRLSTDQDPIRPQPVELKPTTLSHPPSSLKSVQWYAANLHYRQPYFEEYLLERQGFSYGPIIQPAVSAARFFTTATLLPALRHSRHRCEVFDHRDSNAVDFLNCK